LNFWLRCGRVLSFSIKKEYNTTLYVSITNIMMVSQKVHLRRCAATSSLQRTYSYASLLSFCAPYIWNFLRNHRVITYQIRKEKEMTSEMVCVVLTTPVEESNLQKIRAVSERFKVDQLSPLILAERKGDGSKKGELDALFAEAEVV